LLYPPGAGGNQLTNLLTTHDIFTNGFESNNYTTELLDLYKHNKSKDFDTTRNVHFSNNNNLEIETLRANITRLAQADKINVLAGHLGNFLLVKNLLEQLPNKYYIVFDLPPADSGLAYDRIKSYGKFSSYVYSEQQGLYKEDVVSRLADTTLDKVFTFNVNHLFLPTTDSIREFVQQNLRIELPTVVDDLHTLWYNMMIPKRKENDT
jgi:hypothetical protein